MNHRRSCLIELYGFHVERGRNKYVPADSLDCLKTGDERYLSAFNQLLGEGVILSIRGPDQRVVARLNPGKMDIVWKELYPWYRDLRLWVIAVAGVIALGCGILNYVMK